MRNFNIHRIFRKGVKQRFPVINCCVRGLANSVSSARQSQQRLRACVRACVRTCVRVCVRAWRACVFLYCECDVLVVFVDAILYRGALA